MLFNVYKPIEMTTENYQDEKKKQILVYLKILKDT